MVVPTGLQRRPAEYHYNNISINNEGKTLSSGIFSKEGGEIKDSDCIKSFV